MTRESEVPINLQIAELKGEAGAGYGDIVKLVDSIPSNLSNECPDCGESTTPSSVFVNDVMTL